MRSWHDISPRRSSRLHGGQYSPVASERYQQQTYYSNGSIPVEVSIQFFFIFFDTQFVAGSGHNSMFGLSK